MEDNNSSANTPDVIPEKQINIFLRPVAQAPALKKNKIIMPKDSSILQLEKFLRKQLKHNEQLVIIYITNHL